MSEDEDESEDDSETGDNTEDNLATLSNDDDEDLYA
jgi:hypothetical protein